MTMTIPTPSALDLMLVAASKKAAEDFYTYLVALVAEAEGGGSDSFTDTNSYYPTDTVGAALVALGVAIGGSTTVTRAYTDNAVVADNEPLATSIDKLDTAAKTRIRHVLVTIQHSDLVDAALSQSLNVGAALPTGAEVLGVLFDLTTAFSGGGSTAVDLEIGIGADPNAFMTSTTVFTGAPAGRTYGGRGVWVTGSGAQVQATFTADVNVDLLTAGQLDVLVMYAAVGV